MTIPYTEATDREFEWAQRASSYEPCGQCGHPKDQHYAAGPLCFAEGCGCQGFFTRTAILRRQSGGEGPRVWKMYALRSRPDRDAPGFYGIGDYRYAQLHGGNPVSVTVTEDPEGNMLGWIYTGDDTPVMIQHHRIFAMQFPYGPKAEADRGRGAIVHLRVEADETPEEEA